MIDEQIPYPLDIAEGFDDEPGDSNEPSFPPIVDNDAGPVFISKESGIDLRSFDEKMQGLVDGMPGQRFVLLAILDACKQRKDDESITEIVNEAQRDNRSVYSAVGICRMLQKAGALDRVLEDGSIYDESEFQPEMIVGDDGQEYLQASEPPVLYWETTEDGARYADSDDPIQRTLDLIEENRIYLPIYSGILEMCSDGGKKTSALNKRFDDDELLKEPRLYTSHFLQQLEEAGALRWEGSWVVTDDGREALGKLA